MKCKWNDFKWVRYQMQMYWIMNRINWQPCRPVFPILNFERPYGVVRKPAHFCLDFYYRFSEKIRTVVEFCWSFELQNLLYNWFCKAHCKVRARERGEAGGQLPPSFEPTGAGTSPAAPVFTQNLSSFEQAASGRPPHWWMDEHHVLGWLPILA